MSARRGAAALAALAAILLITASWWALALWPLGDGSPEWLARTREVCFGAVGDGLPDGGGWTLLVGQPLGMLLLLVIAWGDEVRAGFRWLLDGVAGQITVGLASAAVVAGLVGVGARVRDASAQEFSPSNMEALGRELTRIDDVPAKLALVNQDGRTITLDAYHGRAVLVTFAYAHCTTVCPLVVHSALVARDRIAESAPERTPVVVVVTLDPWRDTPARLPALARKWGVTGDAHVLSAEAEVVERTLNAWRIPRVRNERTGEISHPSLVYVIGPTGRMNYVVQGSVEQILAALRAL
ncbi:MAG TPA: SCO family protein [Gemmatimonadaceae bacterium]|nr:SCO family protein [Gemmatimonadaceae bacterium]